MYFFTPIMIPQLTVWTSRCHLQWPIANNNIDPPPQLECRIRNNVLPTFYKDNLAADCLLFSVTLLCCCPHQSWYLILQHESEHASFKAPSPTRDKNMEPPLECRMRKHVLPTFYDHNWTSTFYFFDFIVMHSSVSIVISWPTVWIRRHDIKEGYNSTGWETCHWHFLQP